MVARLGASTLVCQTKASPTSGGADACRDSSLERQTKSHLDDPGGKRRADRAKSGARHRRVGRLEIRLVKEIEILGAIFQFALLAAQAEVLVQDQVGLVDRVAADGVAA